MVPKMNMFNHFIISSKISFVILFLLGVLTYSNALNHPFMIDDHAFFDEMDHRWGNLLYQFIPDKSKVLQMEGAKNEVYYRPLGVVLPKILFLLFGQNVLFFHLVNLTVFILACWVVFFFVRALSGNALMALLTAVFYLVHPLNGIIVNYKTGLGFAVQVMCMAGSLLMVISAVNRQRSAGKEQVTAESLRLTISSVLLFLLSMFCHESAMMLPFLGFAVFWAIRRENNGIADQASFALRTTAPLWGALAVCFLLRMRFASLQESIFQKFAGYKMNAAEYLATVMQMGWWYLSRVVTPDGIVISVYFPVERTHVVPWLAVLAMLLALWVFMAFKSYRNATLWTALWMVAFGFGLLSVGCLFHGQDLMIEPHWFVFPSIGIFLILAYAIVIVMRTPLRPYVIAGVAVLVVSWGLTSRSYNALWQNERNYCLYWLKQNPNFNPIHMYIARSYFTERRFDEAAYHYKRALTGQYPDYLMYANLGTIAFLQGRMDEAEYFLKRTLAIEPRTKVALNTLAIVSLKRGKMDEAEKYLKLSIAANRFNIASRWNLALLYERSSRPHEARALYQEILAINPGHAGALSKIKNRISSSEGR